MSLRASLVRNLPPWAMYHVPFAVRTWLAPEYRVLQLLYRDRVFGYVTIGKENVASGGWQNGTLFPIYQLSADHDAANDSKSVINLLVSSNDMRPDPKAAKIVQLEHGAQLENVMRQQALLRFDGPHLSQNVRSVDSSDDALSFPSGLRLPFWHSLAMRVLNPLLNLMARTPIQAAKDMALNALGKVRQDVEQQAALREYYSAVNMQSVWTHFESIRAAMLRLVLAKPSSSSSSIAEEAEISRLLDERNWHLRERIVDSAAVKLGIQLPALASSPDSMQIQWQWRQTGLVVFHPDPKFARMSYMKAPPVVMQRNDLYVHHYVRSVLARSGLKLPTSIKPLKLHLKKPTSSKSATSPDDSASPPPSTPNNPSSDADASSSDAIPQVAAELYDSIDSIAGQAKKKQQLESEAAAEPEIEIDDAPQLQVCSFDDALSTIGQCRATHEAELKLVTDLLGDDHYQTFRLRHVLTCFDRLSRQVQAAAQNQILKKKY